MRHRVVGVSRTNGVRRRGLALRHGRQRELHARRRCDVVCEHHLRSVGSSRVRDLGVRRGFRVACMRRLVEPSGLMLGGLHAVVNDLRGHLREACMNGQG